MAVRVTSDQAATLFDNLKRHNGPRKATQSRVRRPAAELPENILESQILGFLRSRGWMMIRQHAGKWVPYYLYAKAIAGEKVAARIVQMHEPGCADWMAIRPFRPTDDARPSISMVEMFFLEAKAPGKKPSPEQTKWLRDRCALGFEADWFDGLDDGFEHDFLPWYTVRFA